MKKWSLPVLAAGMVCACLLAGCGNKASGVEEVLEAGIKEADAESASSVVFWDEPAEGGSAHQSGLNADAPVPEKNETDAVRSNTEGIDVDLTVLSSTMVYSEVYNMMYTPADYIGKTVKMEGAFSAYHDEETGKDYFACIVQDATACCSQGIEFVLKDSYNYPDDYPEDGETIAVVGTFDTYQEGEFMYCTLRDAEIV